MYPACLRSPMAAGLDGIRRRPVNLASCGLGQYLGLNLSWLPVSPSCSLYPRNSSRFSLQKHCVKVWCGPVLSYDCYLTTAVKVC
jgi:hypothetical protein